MISVVFTSLSVTANSTDNPADNHYWIRLFRGGGPEVDLDDVTPAPWLDMDHQWYYSYRIPSIVRAQNGNLIAFAEGRVNDSYDEGDIDVVYRIYDESTSTWGPLKLLCSLDTHTKIGNHLIRLGNTCGNPTAVVDHQTGRIWVMMNYNEGIRALNPEDAELPRVPIKAGDRRIKVAYSEDNGQTFSHPADITIHVQAPSTRWDAVGPGLAMQVEDSKDLSQQGKLVFPALNRNIIYDRHAPPGEQWSTAPMRPGEITNEASIVERNDGAWIRSDRASPSMPELYCTLRRPMSVSEDYGMTWSEWYSNPDIPVVGDKASCQLIDDEGRCQPFEECLDFYSPNPSTTWEFDIYRCQGSIRRYTKDLSIHRIMATNPAGPNYRTNLTLRVSYDEGDTWPIAREIFPHSAGYSALVKTADYKTGVLYEVTSICNSQHENCYKECDDETPEDAWDYYRGCRHDILFQKFPLSWILGRCVEPLYIAGNAWVGNHYDVQQGQNRYLGQFGWVQAFEDRDGTVPVTRLVERMWLYLEDTDEWLLAENIPPDDPHTLSICWENGGCECVELVNVYEPCS